MSKGLNNKVIFEMISPDSKIHNPIQTVNVNLINDFSNSTIKVKT
jgi:hypothetical protein